MTRPTGNLKRRVAIRDPKEVFLVVVQQQREVEYLRWIVQRLDRFPVQIRTERTTDPREAIKFAAKTRKDEGRKGSPIDQVWCLLNDTHGPIGKEILDFAREQKVLLARSVPSIELWLVLHFFDHQVAATQQELESKLEEAGLDDLGQLAGLFEQAAARARSLRQDDQGGVPRLNPRTDMDLLIEAIHVSMDRYVGATQ